MKDFWSKYSKTIYRAIIFCTSIILMAYFMPREKYTAINYEEGKPWEHEQLIAEFGFKVMKSDKQLAAEKDSITRSTMPHFIYKQNVKNIMYDSLERKLSGMISNITEVGINSHTKRIYMNMVDDLYSTGIVSDKDAETIKKKKYKNCRISNHTNTVDASKFISVSEAKSRMADPDDSESDMVKEHLSKSITPNYIFDSLATKAELDMLLGQIDPVLDSIISGQRIINNREVIDAKKFRILETYFQELEKIEEKYAEKDKQNILFGQILFIIIVMTALTVYLALYQRDVIENTNKFGFTILAASFFPIVAGIMMTTGSTSIYILPFAIAPAMLCLFINNNVAIIAHMTSVLICSVMLGSPYEFVILQFTTGISAIISLKELSSRSQMFKCALATLLTYSLTYLCYILIKEADITKTNYSMYVYFLVSSSLMTLIYPVMLIVEKAFGFVSSVTLIELSNFNNKLLQKLSQETPGTFQHSIQVGNLAAEAASEVGANSLEVRTGALYHDIGKTENPIYFTENQSGGISPHKALTPIESARVIIKHVTDGLAIAKREKLPKKIQEFITTHHGLSKTGYFYITYKNEHPDEKVDERLFTYPGPQPYTKEQAILSMADCVEAASHSLKEYTEENINMLVDNIIDPKVKNGEFSLSPLTFQDIDKIKKVFKKRLMAIYHTRISYPTEKKKE